MTGRRDDWCETCDRRKATDGDMARHAQEHPTGCPTQHNRGDCWCADLCWGGPQCYTAEVDWRERALQAEARAERAEALSSAAPGPHGFDPTGCPTFHDGCNCTVEALRHNIERAEKAETDAADARDVLHHIANLGLLPWWPPEKQPWYSRCSPTVATRARAVIDSAVGAGGNLLGRLRRVETLARRLLALPVTSTDDAAMGEIVAARDELRRALEEE